MIPAKHSRGARAFFNPYLFWLMKRNFSHFYLANSFIPPVNNDSLIVTPNHISWWDGFFIDLISRKFILRKMHIMILEETLRQFPFFQKLGAFSIDLENSVSLLKTLHYTSGILKEKENFLVIYPQGEIEPYEKRPLQIKRGIKLFVKNSPENVAVLPVGFKVELYNEKKPAIICRFGDYVNRDTLLNDFDIYLEKFNDNLDHLSESAYKKEFIADLFE